MKYSLIKFVLALAITLLISCSSSDTILDAGNGKLLIRLDKNTYSISTDDRITVTHENISDEEIYVDMYSVEEKTNNKWGEERPWIALDGVVPMTPNKTWQNEISFHGGYF